MWWIGGKVREFIWNGQQNEMMCTNDVSWVFCLNKVFIGNIFLLHLTSNGQRLLRGHHTSALMLNLNPQTIVCLTITVSTGFDRTVLMLNWG